MATFFETGDPGDHDDYFNFLETTWEDGYIPEHDVTAPEDTADDVQLAYAGLNAEQSELFPVIDPTVLDELRPLAVVMDEIEEDPDAAFFASVEFESLLRTTGMKIHIKPHSLSGLLLIEDGKKFVGTLLVVPEGDAYASEPLQVAIDTSLQTICRGYVPEYRDEATLLQPELLPEIIGDNAALKAHTNLAIQLLTYAQPMAARMEQLGMDPDVVAELRHAHMANAEGLLGEWAIMAEWGVFTGPKNAFSTEWMQWEEPEEWQAFQVLIRAAVEKAGTNSPFLTSAAETLLGNIDRVSNNVAYFLHDRDLQEAYKHTLAKAAKDLRRILGR